MTKARGSAVVAVGLDEQSDVVVAVASSMARRFDMALRLVHVVTPIQDSMLAWQYAAATTTFVFPPYAALDDTLPIDEARSRMTALLGSVGPGVEASGVVLRGLAVPSVVAEAVAQGANVIVTACNPERYGAFLGGFSTALGLMHESPLPVLAVSRTAQPDFAKSAFRILLADDLQPETLEASRRTFELAGRLPKAIVRQVHVHGNLREFLKNSWHDLQVNGLAGADWAGTADELLATEDRVRIERISARGEPARKLAGDAGVTVEVDVRTGNVPAELARAMAEFNPDLVVFGRHRLLHTRPFLIGRMPFRAMLEDRRPVLLVPPAAEALSRRPFTAE